MNSTDNTSISKNKEVEVGSKGNERHNQPTEGSHKATQTHQLNRCKQGLTFNEYSCYLWTLSEFKMYPCNGSNPLKDE